MDATLLGRRPLEQRRRDTLTLEWRTDGSLWATKGDEERPVSVRRCFPWSEPAHHLSPGSLTSSIRAPAPRWRWRSRSRGSCSR